VDRAFERLYRRHAADVYRYALGVLRNQADAEDVTQTTFLNAFRALERGEQPLAPHNWLIAIAHNVCRQRFRAAARRPREVELHDVAERLVVDDDDVPSPEDITRALGQLAFNQRAAIVMREIEGRSYADIAEVLGLSISAVETLIFRARRALREQLEGSLTCAEAELAISRQLDHRLSRAEKGQLRAHLRECADCATVARRQRAQRSALRALGGIPLPPSLAGLFGGGGASIAAKVAAVVLATGAAGGVGYDLHRSLTAAPSATAKPPLRHAVTPPAAPLPALTSVSSLVLDRPAHAAAAAAAVTVPRGRAIGHARAAWGLRHAVPRGRARGRTGLPAAAEAARSRSRGRGASAAANRGRPPWAQAPATRPSNANATGQAHAHSRSTPSPPAHNPSRGAGQRNRGNGRSNSSHAPELPVTLPDVALQGVSDAKGNGASISAERRLHP